MRPTGAKLKGAVVSKPDKNLDGIEDLIKERSAVEAPPTTVDRTSEKTTWTFIEKDWQRMKGRIHDNWPLLSDNEIDATEGDRDRFVATVQDRYGLELEMAEEQVDAWVASLGHPADETSAEQNA